MDPEEQKKKETETDERVAKPSSRENSIQSEPPQQNVDSERDFEDEKTVDTSGIPSDSQRQEGGRDVPVPQERLHNEAQMQQNVNNQNIVEDQLGLPNIFVPPPANPAEVQPQENINPKEQRHQKIARFERLLAAAQRDVVDEHANLIKQVEREEERRAAGIREFRNARRAARRRRDRQARRAEVARLLENNNGNADSQDNDNKDQPVGRENAEERRAEVDTNEDVPQRPPVEDN